MVLSYLVLLCLPSQPVIPPMWEINLRLCLCSDLGATVTSGGDIDGDIEAVISSNSTFLMQTVSLAPSRARSRDRKLCCVPFNTARILLF